LITNYNIISSEHFDIDWEMIVIDNRYSTELKSNYGEFYKKYLTHFVILILSIRHNEKTEDLINYLSIIDPSYRYVEKNKVAMLPHLNQFSLKRKRNDIISELPEKKEYVLSTNLTTHQKQLYLSKLSKKLNIVMQKKEKAMETLINSLQMVCDHPFMFTREENNFDNPVEVLIEISCKLSTLDNLLVKLKEEGHRVIIYSKFERMLTILEDYLFYKKWDYFRFEISKNTDPNTGLDSKKIYDLYNYACDQFFIYLIDDNVPDLFFKLADTIIFYDVLNPFETEQKLNMIYGIGQISKIITIYYIIPMKTVDEGLILSYNFGKNNIDSYSILKYGRLPLEDKILDQNFKIYNYNTYLKNMSILFNQEISSEVSWKEIKELTKMGLRRKRKIDYNEGPPQKKRKLNENKSNVDRKKLKKI